MATGKKQKPATAVSFTEQIRAALNHYDDPEWLGEESPLAAPYFLGDVLTDGTTVRERGEALRKALQLAAASLWPGKLPTTKSQLETAVNEERQQQGNKGPRYRYLLLELRYLRRIFRGNEAPAADNDIAMCDYLSISRASYFNHLKAAQQALGDALLTQCQPTLHLERPLLPEEKLIGRDELLAHCLDDLQNGQSVALSGMGGSGKTTLAATILSQWDGPTFWYTIRTALNDQAESLIFSLGAFLQQQGASSLWQQLVADGGSISSYDLALAAMRSDLAQLPKLLLCIDEIDSLTSSDDFVQPQHVQMREFIDGLRQSAALLVVGQQHVLYLDRHYQLANLTLPQQILFFEQCDIQLTNTKQHQLHEYTSGNPRLLHLCAALAQMGMPVATMLADLPQTSALQALWERLWQRLETDEQLLLQRIAVFRSAVPADGWAEATAALERLRARHLLQADVRGGLTLLPAFRALLLADWQRFPAAKREECHLLAADMRLVRGEYTAVAHHLIQAQEDALAIQVWYPQRALEIQRGFAAMAQATFQKISTRHLPQEEKQALALIRAELLRLTGHVEAGLQEIQSVKWPSSSELTLRADLLRGDFLNELGYPQQALTRYEDGIAVTLRLLNRLVRFRYQRGTVFVQQKELDAAWQEAQIAQHEAAFLQGMVLDEQGHYTEAIAAYEQAIQFAEQLNYEAGLAQAHRALANVYGRNAQLAQAIQHTEMASQIFEHLGDKLNQERVNSTLAATYFQAGQFVKAIEAAEPTTAYFETMGIQFWTAVTAATLAEAYFEVGDLDKARATAEKVLRLEETQTFPYALYTLGLIAKAEEKWTQAESCFQQSQQIAEENGDRFMAAYAWRALGDVQMAASQSEEAVNSWQQALSLFESMQLTQEIEVTKRALERRK